MINISVFTKLDRLDWKCNTDALYKQRQSRLHVLRKIRAVSAFRKMLKIFYKSVVESAISSVWGAASDLVT